MRTRLIAALLAALVAGLLCLGWLLAIPGESQLVSGLGYSALRLALIAGMLLLWLGLVVLLVSLRRGGGPGQRLLAALENLHQHPGQTLWALQAAAFTAGTSLGTLLLYQTLDPQTGYPSAFQRFLPFVFWSLVLALLTALLCWQAAAAAPGNVTATLLASLGLVGALLLFFWLAAQVFTFTIDDAYITFRYSHNLATGLGPTYNPDPPRAEGYTTLLWMLLMTVPHLAGISVVLFAKGMGLAATLGTFALLYWLVVRLDRSSGMPHLFASLAVFFLAALPATAIHAVSGMETALFTLVLLMVAALGASAVIAGASAGWRLWLLPVAALLLGLTRPEGNLAAGGMLVAVWLCLPAEQRRRLLGYSLLLYLLPGAVYFSWRWWYYGLPLPLPFYFKTLKVGRPLAGAREVGLYLLAVLPPIGLLLAAAVLRWRRELALLVVAVILLLGFYLFPAHVLGFNWRFVYPTAPLIYALAGYGAGALAAWLAEAAGRTRLQLVLLAIGLLLIGLAPLSGASATLETAQRYARDITAPYTRLGQILGDYRQANPAAKPPTLALADAGAIPYYSGWRTIDTLGLNDAHLALEPTSVDTNYLLAQQPDLMLVVSQQPEELVRAGRTQITYAQALLQAGMQPVKIIRLAEEAYLWLLADPERPVAKYLQEALAGWSYD